MNITRNVGGKRLCIDQRQYAEEVLRRFNMSDCKPVDTPLDPGLDLSIDDKENTVNVPYQEAVGSLLYLSQISRELMR